MALPQPPKLLYQTTLQRRPYFRRALLSLLGLLTGLIALYTVHEADAQGTLPAGLWLPGILVALIFTLFFALRFLIQFIRWLTSRDENLRLYNKGIVWQRGAETLQYGWQSIRTFREGRRAVILTLKDGEKLHFNRKYGDLARIAAIIRPYAARVTGVYMARAIREEKPVKIHSKVVVWPGGVEINNHEIPWALLEVRLINRKLTFYRRSESGKFQQVQAFDIQSVDNVGGFLELALSTIKNHQRERYGV
ncbi:MAG: hypothetical protein J0L63_12605 [Anaerolineae bacterium]|nr:hypothetical protein [Anaerolineae bacterium]MBN8619743.1 hypothetical protein [Anaerolineae bacterium]